MANQNRPLSPHLQVYRPQITSFLSILHRATGVVLAISAQALFGSIIGQLILWGFTFSVFYHLANGIRHMAWDAGWGFELDRLRITGWLTIVFAAAMTVLTLVVAYSAAGGA
jgi:succinate dehydrogenase / fumarate reductase cytochrome b subunit